MPTPARGAWRTLPAEEMIADRLAEDRGLAGILEETGVESIDVRIGGVDLVIDQNGVERGIPIVNSRHRLLDLPMPSGKTMAECSGAELAEIALGLARIAKVVGSDRIVGDVFGASVASRPELAAEVAISAVREALEKERN